MAKAAREAYEDAVLELAAIVARLRHDGLTEEQVAREAVDRRNALKLQFRAGDPPAAVAAMERRNLAKYGHPLGPTADQLFAKYGDWTLVIAAACRPMRLSKLL